MRRVLKPGGELYGSGRIAELVEADAPEVARYVLGKPAADEVKALLRELSPRGDRRWPSSSTTLVVE